ncbi:MAG: alkaline phosphatase [Comamonadaceae bacterium]|nr:alkaline phosphatase [Comamonadaceae bacterium]
MSQAQAPAGRPPAGGAPAAERARNVILFIGDAGGLPTLNAASLYGYDRPQALFIQKMPNIALMDTSTASNWVTDSAAGMTAIVTGRKTHNGVLSQADDAVRGKQDGARLKTILEYAEERGLSTGVISNDSMAGATPAACYAHANNRSDTAGIIAQLGKPRAGNGVDLVLGSGRSAIDKAAAAAGLDLDAHAARRRLRPARLARRRPPGHHPRRRADGRVRLRPVGDRRERHRRALPEPEGLLPHGRMGPAHRRC